MATITILDVGHGSCAVVVDNGRAVVIDTGRGNMLLHYLRSHGVTHVDAVLVSHADEDHIRGLHALLNAPDIELGTVALNTDSLKGSNVWDDLVFSLAERERRGELSFQVSLTPDDTGKFDTENVKVEVLAPGKYMAARGPGSTTKWGATNSNTISAVVRLWCKKRDQAVLLVMADLDEVGLKDMIGRGVEMRAPNLVFPHHGGRSGGDLGAFADRVVDAVRPARVIFSIGRGRYNTPRQEVIDAIRKRSAKTEVLCTQLSTNCAKDIPKLKPRWRRDDLSLGGESGACCCGTFTIVLENRRIKSIPLLRHHRTYVNETVPKGLCVK